MTKLLDDEYGWMTGFTELEKFRDNIVSKTKIKFNTYYQVLLL